MSIQLKYNKVIKADDSVFIIESKSDLKRLKLSKGDLKYLSNKVEKSSFGFIIKDGVYTIIAKFSNLKEAKNKEELRKFGHDIFELLKGECNEVQIEGKSETAIFLLMEGLALSSYEFLKYFADKKKIFHSETMKMVQNSYEIFKECSCRQNNASVF